MVKNCGFNKYFFRSSGPPNDREPTSFSLELAFPSSWNCDWVHVSEARWGGQPAAKPLCLPFLHKHKNLSTESAERRDRCTCYQRMRLRKEARNETSIVTVAVNWPFGQLGQSPWSFGDWDLVSGECRPPGRKHGPQSGWCFLCGREPRFIDTIS